MIGIHQLLQGIKKEHVIWPTKKERKDSKSEKYPRKVIPNTSLRE